MADFTTVPAPTPLFVHTNSRWSVLPEIFKTANLSSFAVSVTWTANTAIYVPVSIPWAYPVNRVFWINGSVVTTSNADFGIYSPGGTRIYSTGSTTQSGASSVQYVTPSSPFILPAGVYYFAWTSSGTTNRAFGLACSAVNGRQCGLVQQATALPLPATATFATYANIGVPTIGITRTTSGF